MLSFGAIKGIYILRAYLYFNQVVLSSITIPELPPANVDKAGMIFSLESPKKNSRDQIWLHHWISPTGEKLLSYRKEDKNHWLRFLGLADFRISANLKKISCYPLLDVSHETVRHLLLDQVLPRCLAHQGKIMLHASAVQLEPGLILFIGDSGAGKSTLAGNFHQAGQSVVSDDCLWIKENKDRIVAIPSYGGLRLWEDSMGALFSPEQEIHSMAHYSTKKRLPLSSNKWHGYGNGLPVLAVLVLSPPAQDSASDINLERLTPREAFIAMLRQTFQLDLTDLKRMTRHVEKLGHIVPRLPVYRLSMPRDYSLLPLVRQKILETVL